MPRLLLVLASATNLYLLGVMVLFGAVLYPMFGSVDKAAFPALYQSFNGRIGVPVVAVEFAAFLVPLALYWRPTTPLWIVHAVVVCGVVYFAITFGWHLPAHKALATGDNGDLVTLLRSQWARSVVQVVRCALLSAAFVLPRR